MLIKRQLNENLGLDKLIQRKKVKSEIQHKLRVNSSESEGRTLYIDNERFDCYEENKNRVYKSNPNFESMKKYEKRQKLTYYLASQFDSFEYLFVSLAPFRLHSKNHAKESAHGFWAEARNHLARRRHNKNHRDYHWSAREDTP